MVKSAGLLQKVNDFGVRQKVDACARQQHSELVALFQGAFDRIDLLLVLDCFLLLLCLYNPKFEQLHRLEKLIESKLGLVFQLLLNQQLLRLRRIPAQALNYSLQLLNVDVACLFFVEHVENAPEVFDLLLVIRLEDI